MGQVIFEGFLSESPFCLNACVIKRHKAPAAGGAEVEWMGCRIFGNTFRQHTLLVLGKQILVWVESRRLQTHVAESFLAEGPGVPETVYS